MSSLRLRHLEGENVVGAEPIRRALDESGLGPLGLLLGEFQLSLIEIGLGRCKLGLSHQMLPGLIERFYQDAERLLRQAHEALEERRAGDLHRASHSLKSTGATFGARALSAVARKVEVLAQEGRLEAVAEQLAEAQVEFARAKAALEAMQNEA